MPRRWIVWAILLIALVIAAVVGTGVGAIINLADSPAVIGFITQLPGWLIEHRWAVTLAIIAGMAGLSAITLLNPRGRQLREVLRRKR